MRLDTSSTERPVTHTALVAMNSASTKPTRSPIQSPGSTRKPSVPVAISAANEPTSSCGAERSKRARAESRAFPPRGLFGATPRL